jgi:hypothetical protein
MFVSCYVLNHNFCIFVPWPTSLGPNLSMIDWPPTTIVLLSAIAIIITRSIFIMLIIICYYHLCVRQPCLPVTTELQLRSIPPAKSALLPTPSSPTCHHHLPKLLASPPWCPNVQSPCGKCMWNVVATLMSLSVPNCFVVLSHKLYDLASSSSLLPLLTNWKSFLYKQSCKNKFSH